MAGADLAWRGAAVRYPPGMKLLRRIAVAVVGGAVLLVGIVMIVLPGPAILVIPAGLAILAIEFVWAKRLLHRMRDLIAAKKENKQNKR